MLQYIDVIEECCKRLKTHSISVSVVDFEINGSFNLPSGDPLLVAALLCSFVPTALLKECSKYSTAPANIPDGTNLSTLPYSVTIFAHSHEYPVMHSVDVELNANPSMIQLTAA
jgi:hypothetical protein